MPKILKIAFPLLFLLICVTGGILFLLSKYSITLRKKTDVTKSNQPILAKTPSLPLSEKKIALPLYHISFNIPANLVVQPVNTGNSYVSSLEEVKVAMPNAIDSGSDYKKKGINIVYSILQPWTPNIYNIPFGSEFNGEGKTTQLDSASLLKDGSILSPNQVTMYTYLLGDDEGHNRGKYGMAYQGDVRLDLKMTDNVRTNEAIYFKCTDNSAQIISNTCETTLKAFLSTLRIQSALEVPSPSSFDNKDYFPNLEFKKRQFAPQERVLQNGIFTDQSSSFAYFSATQDAQLTKLSDDELQVMRCMPQQLYLTETGYPYYSQAGRSNIYAIRTTDGNNLFHEVQVTDPNLLRIIINLQNHNQNNQVKQFFACQTDDGRYILKYNLTPANPHAIVANIAVMSKQGDIQDISSILLPEQNIFCEKPLALTTNNIFYFGCQATAFNGTLLTNIRYIYKVDLTTKTENLLSQCESTSTQTETKPTIECQ